MSLKISSRKAKGSVSGIKIITKPRMNLGDPMSPNLFERACKFFTILQRRFCSFSSPNLAVQVMILSPGHIC
jgi:hypothetical protein